MSAKFIGIYDVRKRKLSIRKTKKDQFDPYFSSEYKIKFFFSTNGDPSLAALNALRNYLAFLRDTFLKNCLNEKFLNIKTKDNTDDAD